MSVIDSIAAGRSRRPAADRAARCLSSDMLLVHKVFRREFEMMPGLIGAVADTDQSRAATLAAHGRELSTALRHHHESERDLLLPRVRDRVSLDPTVELVLRDRQRANLALLGEFDVLLPLWEVNADTEVRDALVDILTELSASLSGHLDTSESAVLAAVDQHFTAAEWLTLGLRAASWIPLHRMAWMLGAMLEDATPAERDNLMAKVPGPARLLFRMVGQEQYDREMRAVRSTSA